MESSSESTTSAESCSKFSSRVKHAPGTPKPPIDPPRRRSSLFFAKVLQHHSPKTPSTTTYVNSEDKMMLDKNTSSTGARNKGHPFLEADSTATPGHVAQMQKLFQSAKASLRLDVRFASSPSGSIDSRLPSGSESPKLSSDIVQHGKNSASKNWRYSTAPRLLAEIELDVREPFPEGSPQLPVLTSRSVSQSKMLATEPLSSGFTSPVVNMAREAELQTSEPPGSDDLGSLLVPTLERVLKDAENEEKVVLPESLNEPLRNLRVTGDDEIEIDGAEKAAVNIPLAKKHPRTRQYQPRISTDSDDSISLSASARAAADSAKLKRGVLSNLFPKPPVRDHNSASASSEEPSTSPAENNICPDPSVHDHRHMVLCPEPGLHFAKPFDTSGNGNVLYVNDTIPGFHRGYHNHALPHNRTTANGSPIATSKIKSSPSPDEMRRQSHDSWYATPPIGAHRHHHHRPHTSRREHPSAGNEHFRPGWYYARDPRQNFPREGPAMYSFSTAAAKVVGYDPAPDSRIRDAYRTDTLTPLAKPPSRYKKHGIIALANSRGVGKFYGGPAYNPRPHLGRKHSHRGRLPDDMRFRSSPPRSYSESEDFPQSRKRPRDAEVSPTDIVQELGIREQDEAVDPKLRLEEGEEIMEVDEETRAAIRMSLYGTPTTDSSMKELSPNVMAWRKGRGGTGSRKKRRPSYWDGDLEEVVRSPAARHIVSSPIKKDDVRSQQAEVEWHDEMVENRISMSDDELEGISGIAEGPTIMQEDVQMRD